ncbi:MAG: M20/M25/M40 family metallo-hydrolase, partial [Deltaproteobacteria bacterium]|nr:M20/M25/M40 family metallo-hydrolase [Deltaproteobacteria bacterium]
MPITETAKGQAPLEAMQGYLNNLGAMLRSTAELVAIPSVTQALDASSATPFGVESDRAVDKLLADMGALGYRTEKDATGYFGYGEFGNPDAKNWVLIAGHVDVVDPLKRADWFGGDPFATNLRVVDGGVYLVGRGWSDDKGPTAAATYGLAQLIGQPLRDDVRVGVAIFPDEEKGIWAGAKKFVELKGLPSVALAPDHEYAITQEMAKLGFSVVGEGTPEPDKENLITVSSINTGSNPGNTVPGEVEVVFKAKNKSFIEFFLSSITRHAKDLNGSVEKVGDIEKPNGSYVLKVVVKGKAVHAAKAYEGVNAVQVLAQLLEKAPMEDNVPSRLVYFILEGIGLGARGEAFGFQGGDPAKVG